MSNRKLPSKDVLVNMRNAGMTLQEIADEYSCSRERVRQVIGNTGLSFMRNWTKNNIPMNMGEMTREDLKNIRGTAKILQSEFAKIHHKFNGGSVKTGEEAEQYIANEINKTGMTASLMPTRCEYDILVNGLRVDVKSCMTNQRTSAFQKSDMYKFKVRRNKKDSCDFFICVIPSMEYFVIPSSILPKTEYLYITWPKPRKSWSKYHQYYKRLDLLNK